LFEESKKNITLCLSGSKKEDKKDIVTATQGEKSVKEIVHRKIKSLSSFTYDFLSSMGHKKTLDACPFPCNGELVF